MVYIHSWQEFQDAAEGLYANSPNNARYCVKWKSSEGKLVLKITDNTTCIKFKTHSSIFLNRFESLNLSLMQKMQNHTPRPEPTEAPSGAITTLAGSSGAEASSSVAGSSATPVQTPSTGGVKKKKPKKKK